MTQHKRVIYDPEHEILRNEIRSFLAEFALPKLDDWEKQGHAERVIWNQLGEIGGMSCMLPEAYGGTEGDMRMAAVIYEEIGRCGVAGMGGIGVHDIVAYYLLHHGNDKLKDTWLPKAANGDALFAVAMTEPGAGSDLRGIKLVHNARATTTPLTVQKFLLLMELWQMQLPLFVAQIPLPNAVVSACCW